jgi:response regulator RpfG family c-di-GMP phosphodiesterase
MVGHEMVYQKEYGIWHTLLFVVIGCYFVVGLTGIIYAFVKKSEVSRIVLILLILPEALSLFGFWGARLISSKIEIIPILYVVAQLVYLLIIRRITFYNINETVIDSMVQTGETGLISFDLGYRYLGSNETAKEIIPGLKDLHVDQNLIECEFLNHNVLHWIKHFKDEAESKNLYVVRDPENEENNKAYIVDVNYLYHGSKIKGYDLLLRDDTKNQKYIELLDKYNNELEEEVDRKTKRIVEMHDNLIMSMAMMVEGRDNSTGGHVKRVSDCTRMLIEEIKQDNKFGLSDEFFRDVIKAAPLHDIGKITIEDAILRKEGRYDDKEYEIMKTHAAEGAKILRKILKDTDDESYKKIAENVAHYHHERVDGKGYPDHLKGEEIPIEARIVAVADVYDALACRRVYKGRMSFEEVDSIIMEGMGTQFDKDLEEYYVKAREHFEDYYTSLQQTDSDFDKVK